jgi:hypothetical protein
VSTAVAWRYTLGDDLMRTADGRTWTVADDLSPTDSASQPAVVDATTAVMVRPRVTRDGGQTWSVHPLVWGQPYP